MKFYEYFKEEWEKQKIFTSEELEEMKTDGEHFIDYFEFNLDFMDKSKYSKEHKKDFDFISDNDKKKIAKELMHRIVIYALEYFSTKKGNDTDNNKSTKWLNDFRIKKLKQDIQNFKRYKNPSSEIIQKHKANKEELRRLKQRPADKIKEDTLILSQALEIIKKVALPKEDKNITTNFINTLINDIRLQDFIFARRHEYYIDDIEKKQGSLNKMAIKNYLMEVSDRYNLKAKTKINEFCRSIFSLFDIKKYKKLK